MKKYESPKLDVNVFGTTEYICASSEETSSSKNVIELPDDEWQ